MNKGELWDITNKEQTQIKLNILVQYLRKWAIIIGERFTEGIISIVLRVEANIRGMAGMGKVRQ